MKIRGEQADLSKERDTIEKILKSETRLKNLIRQEILDDKEKYGDDRRSPIVARPEAKALREEEMIPAEAITIVLSKQGWVRAAKGHEVEGASLSYRAGDEFAMQTNGRSNMPVIFLDSEGKSYSLPAHLLPSARGQGEPLTKYLQPAPGAYFVVVLCDDSESEYVLSSDFGYGFITKVENLYSKTRTGKTVLRLQPEAKILKPQRIIDKNSQYLAAITNEGRLLLFPVAELPELARGKGNKIIQIPNARAIKHEEFCQILAVINEKSSLTLISGKRQLRLTAKDLANFQGERGQRGSLLPRGFRQVDSCQVD